MPLRTSHLPRQGRPRPSLRRGGSGIKESRNSLGASVRSRREEGIPQRGFSTGATTQPGNRAPSWAAPSDRNNKCESATSRGRAALSVWLKITGPNLLAPQSQRKRLNNQAVWPVIFGLTGPICARALNLKIRLRLSMRGHHDWAS